MPTAGTSQVMGCSECFEPHMSNIFIRTTMAGEFVIVNENLVKMLAKHNLWNDDMRKMLILNNGSIQKINSIPQYIKNIFKTAFEIQLKSIISQAADRSPFIDQSQSMNLFMATPNFKILTSAHFYGWERGLKTGMYYLRTMPAANPVSFGVDIDDVKRLEKKNKEYTEDNSPSCRREKGCVVCGS
jgi:ribonucleotide reductase alpha subunit